MNRRLASLLVPVAVALAASLAGWAALTAVRDELPSPLATHWGPGGTADGFSSFSGVVTSGIALSVGMALVFALLGMGLRQSAALGAVASGAAVFMAGVIFGSAYLQRGLADAAESQLSNAVFGWPLVAGVLTAAVVGLILRRPESFRGTGPLPAGSPRADVADTARVAWSGSLRQNTAAVVSLLIAVAVVLALGVALWLTSGIWFVALVGVALAIFIPLLRARVTIDRRGVRVTSLGLTWKTIPLAGIDHADVREVQPLGEYGGFGLRAGFDGSWGFVTSAGPAVRIDRGSDPAWVLTVDDAESAAAVLNTLVERVRSA